MCSRLSVCRERSSPEALKRRRRKFGSHRRTRPIGQPTSLKAVAASAALPIRGFPVDSSGVGTCRYFEQVEHCSPFSGLRRRCSAVGQRLDFALSPADRQQLDAKRRAEDDKSGFRHRNKHRRAVEPSPSKSPQFEDVMVRRNCPGTLPRRSGLLASTSFPPKMMFRVGDWPALHKNTQPADQLDLHAAV